MAEDARKLQDWILENAGLEAKSLPIAIRILWMMDRERWEAYAREHTLNSLEEGLELILSYLKAAITTTAAQVAGPPAEGECLLSPSPPAEGKCLLVLPPQPEGEEPERPQPEGEEPERPTPEWEEPERPTPEWEEPERPTPEWEEPERPTPEWEEPERPTPEWEEPERPTPEWEEPERPTPEWEEPERPTPEWEEPEPHFSTALAMEMDGIYTGLQKPSEDVYSTVNQPQGKRAGAQQGDPTLPVSAAGKASSYRQPALVLLILCCLLLAAIISLAVYQRVCCPEKWVPFNGKCYYFSTDKMDWNSSRDNCTSMGGHLVIIESEAEQRFLMNAAKAHPGNLYWIGLTDAVTEGTWLWVDGTPLNDKTQYWGSGEPNDRNGEEDCAHFPFHGDPLNSWNDIGCRENYSRICETIAVIIYQ
ncbi:UNVERIFIED_CONTAM: hypothetical protein FKN15_025667 [Acipenser sinensis]